MNLKYVIDGLGRKAKNVSPNWGDEDSVRSNHSELLRAIQVHSFVNMDPQHKDNVVFVNDSVRDMWTGDLSGPKCDGLMTRLPYVGLECNPADCCVYIMFHQSKYPLLSVIHSGRAGSILRILDKAVTSGANTQGLSILDYARDLQVIQAPAICAEHHQLKYLDVPIQDSDDWSSCILGAYDMTQETAVSRFVARNSQSTIGVDLSKFNKNALLKLGVQPENISITDICTYESKNLFSHRRAADQETENGRFMVLAYMYT